MPAWTSQWPAASIFSGGGGLDLGFLQQGIGTRIAYDRCRKAVAAYNANLPGLSRVADLASATPPIGFPTVLLAGAPCQGFSTVGRRDYGDPRNGLLMRVAEIALASKPAVVVVENVPAALSGPHRQLWEAMEARLRNGGYNVRRLLLDGCRTGVPQRRRRLFLLCWMGSDCIQVELPRRDGLCVREALAAIHGTDGHDVEWPEVDGRDWAVARRIPQGHRLTNVRASSRGVPTWSIPEVFGTVSPDEEAILTTVAKLRRRDRRRSFGDGDPVRPAAIERAIGRVLGTEVDRLVEAGYLRRVGCDLELRHTYNGRYRRLAWGEPSPTVDTKFGRADLFLHPEEHRAMTPREAARLQGFPDYFRLTGSRTDKFALLGNAVPPPMAACLAEFIREAILKA